MHTHIFGERERKKTILCTFNNLVLLNLCPLDSAGYNDLKKRATSTKIRMKI